MPVYDLIVVGGGPAGLSASLSAASEGLRTLIVDAQPQFGGQAVTSTLIENYAGFTDGVTGAELMASMIDQASKFKVDFMAPVRICGINRKKDDTIQLDVDDGSTLISRSVILASGVQYRRLNAVNLAKYLGRGVVYGSPNIASNYNNKSLYVIGGANSAGQAALWLSNCEGCMVHVLIRGDDIADGMSDYLIKRIEARDNISVHTKSELVRVEGDAALRSVVVSDGKDEWVGGADNIFVLIGAMPSTAWMPKTVELDKYGFILAGSGLSAGRQARFVGSCGRLPLPHETSLQGVFVSGDLRADSVKRVAGAVGDGASTVPEVHKYLGLR